MSHLKNTDYNGDFYAWLNHNAALLRQGKFSEIDIDNVAEELEGMARSEKRELMQRLILLLTHLLKWQYPPGGRSWKYAIGELRFSLANLLEESPSLWKELEESLGVAYKKAVEVTVDETNLKERDFPAKCPFTIAQCLDKSFFPDEINNAVATC